MAMNPYNLSLKDLVYNKFNSASNVDNLDFSRLMQGNQPEPMANPQAQVNPDAIVLNNKVVRRNSIRDALGDSLLGIGTGLLTNNDPWQGLGQGMAMAGKSMSDYRDNNALYEQAIRDSQNRQALLGTMGQQMGINIPQSGYMSNTDFTDTATAMKTMGAYDQKKTDQNLKIQGMANTQEWRDRNLNSLIPAREAQAKYLETNTNLLQPKFQLEKDKFAETKANNERKYQAELVRINQVDQRLEIMRQAGVIDQANYELAKQDNELAKQRLAFEIRKFDESNAPTVSKTVNEYNDMGEKTSSKTVTTKATSRPNPVAQKANNVIANPKKYNLSPEEINWFKEKIKNGEYNKVNNALKNLGVN